MHPNRTIYHRKARIAGCVALALPLLALGQNLSEQQITAADREEARLNAGTTAIHDAELDAYLATILQRLTVGDEQAEKIRYRGRALKSVAPYAFSLDNGAVYVSTGLLARLQNESQLAAIIATELTPVIRADGARSSEMARQRAQQSAIPNIFLVAVTAGLAAFPLTKHEQTEHEKLQAALRQESDEHAVGWLQRAGFELAEAPRAFQRLHDTLQAEARFSSHSMSNKAALEKRIASMNAAIADNATDQAVLEPGTAYATFARRFALELAREDLGSSGAGASFHTVLDRFDQEHGANGQSSCMRADYVRRHAAREASPVEAIQSYERCVVFADAPPAALRELAFLYRKQGDGEAARRNFAAYLERVPNAADAPIIRSYMEKL